LQLLLAAGRSRLAPAARFLATEMAAAQAALAVAADGLARDLSRYHSRSPFPFLPPLVHPADLVAILTSLAGQFTTHIRFLSFPKSLPSAPFHYSLLAFCLPQTAF
jgi:hypothetical protein